VRTLWFVASLVSCQKSNDVPQVGSASGSAPVAAPRSTLELPLPAVSGKPPRRTTVALDQAALERLGKLTFPRLARELTPYPASVSIRHRATTRPRMSINVAVGGCSATLPCRPMTVDAWRADEAKLKEGVDAVLVDRPDSKFEIGAASINNTPAVFVYQAGQYFGKDARGNPVGSYSHAYTLHFNDGVNFLRVVVSFADDPRETLAEMTQALPRSFLERTANAFLDAYGQAW